MKTHCVPDLSRYAPFFDPKVLDLSPYREPQSIKTVMMLHYRTYQALALPLRYGEKHDDKTNRTDQHVGKWNDLPYLTIKVDRKSDECRVIGHEGRHRAIWMSSRDITLIPVVLWVLIKIKDQTDGDPMLWTGDDYYPKTIRSQNGRFVAPMPVSIIHPRI